MALSRLCFQRILLLIAGTLFPVLAFAQYPQPTSLTASPNYIYRPGSYELCAGNGGYMTLDIRYTFNNGGNITIVGWPTLEGDGCAGIYANATTPLGTYTFRFAKNTLNQGENDWVPVSTYVTVSVPPQPTSLSFSPNYGYAGNMTCYTMTVGNGANMTVDLRYLISVVQYPDVSITLNANGQWNYCPEHYDRTGTYFFFLMKNHLRSDWVNLNPAVTYALYPPNPTWLSISPTSVIAGQQDYRMTVGNGAQITLDTKYNIDGGPTQTVIAWPTLSAVSPGSPIGYADIVTSTCDTLGVYNYTELKNIQNSVWASVAASLTINPAGPPMIVSVTPGGGVRGSSVDVTITGGYLCNPPPSLSTTWPGLTFSNVTQNVAIRATFNVSPNAPLGTATITLSTPAGSADFQWLITPPAGLTKEYIYLGPRIIATEVP